MFPQTPSSSPETSAGHQNVIFWLLTLLLVFAPLYRAGNRPLSLLVLELGAVLILGAVFWSLPRKLLSRHEAVALGLLAVFPLIYLIPLPGHWMQALPGRDPYETGMELLGIDLSNAFTTLTLVPQATVSAWLSLLIPIAVFLGTRALSASRLLQLVWVLFGIAAVQAVLGLMQFGQGADSPLYWGMTHTHRGSGVGTYPNRNHLAGFLEMVLPIALALLIYSIGRRMRSRGARHWRDRIVFFSTLRGHTAFWYAMLSLLLLVGLVFTRSRAGISLTMLGILLVTVALSRRLGGNNVYGLTGTIVALAAGVGITIGLAPVLDRFTLLDPLEDLRWILFARTGQGIATFFPLGSGPGSYEEVFPAFQSTELGRWVIDYAHNDYLQWLFEGGLFAALLMLLLLGLYFLQWHTVWTRNPWTRFRFVQVGAGIGLLLMLLHELVDYNLLIPANSLYFSFLTGVFFTTADEVANPQRNSHRRKPLNNAVSERDDGGMPEEKTITPKEPQPGQIRNPFLD